MRFFGFCDAVYGMLSILQGLNEVLLSIALHLGCLWGSLSAFGFQFDKGSFRVFRRALQGFYKDLVRHTAV